MERLDYGHLPITKYKLFPTLSLPFVERGGNNINSARIYGRAFSRYIQCHIKKDIKKNILQKSQHIIDIQ